MASAMSSSSSHSSNHPFEDPPYQPSDTTRYDRPDDCNTSLIQPALAYARPSDPLLALPPPSHLRPNRPFLVRLVHACFHTEKYPLPILTTLSCISIFLNGLTANGVYAWPQYGPVIIKQVGFNLSQGQSIVVGGVLGTYLMAAPMGRMCDLKGPRFASLVSAILAFVGYQLFALILSRPSILPFLLDPTEPSGLNLPVLSATLSIIYALIGAAGVGSYFSALTTASLSFPRYPTLALSLPLSCIGLSSLALSSLGRLGMFQETVKLASQRGQIGVIPSAWLVQIAKADLTKELNSVKFLRALGILVPTINIWSSLFMNVVPSNYSEDDLERQKILHNERSFVDSPDTLSPPAQDHLPQLPSESESRPTSPVSSISPLPRFPVLRIHPSYPDDPDHLLNPSEHTPLLYGGPEALYSAAREEEEEAQKDFERVDEGGGSDQGDTASENGLLPGMDVYPPEHHHWNVKKLLRDPGFWAYGFIIVLAVGPPEMTLSSIGAVLTSLLANSTGVPSLSYLLSKTSASSSETAITMAADGASPLELRSKHILYLSISSTIARLITGVVADYLSPIVSPPHSSKTRVGRATLTAVCLTICTTVYLFAIWGMKTEESLWVLSIGIGAMYGALFTLTPAIASRHYGPAHFGLSWGMLSYFSAMGSALFSYLYAFLSEYIASQQNPNTDNRNKNKKIHFDCRGPECFRFTYAVSAVCGVVAVVGMMILGKRWKV